MHKIGHAYWKANPALNENFRASKDLTQASMRQGSNNFWAIGIALMRWFGQPNNAVQKTEVEVRTTGATLTELHHLVEISSLTRTTSTTLQSSPWTSLLGLSSHTLMRGFAVRLASCAEHMDDHKHRQILVGHVSDCSDSRKNIGMRYCRLDGLDLVLQFT